MKYKLKVCGMKDPVNIRELISLDIDFVGFIFYGGSPRYAGRLPPGIIDEIPDKIKKTGVFVDGNPCMVTQTAQKYKLDFIQLHGDESPEYCRRIRNDLKDTGIIKAFGIEDAIDNDLMKTYTEAADYFLFDTRSEQHGGSGKAFNREILQDYQLNIPFFLSGGLDETILNEIRDINLPQLYALDINSRFETAPGVKDISRIEKFIRKLRS